MVPEQQAERIVREAGSNIIRSGLTSLFSGMFNGLRGEQQMTEGPNLPAPGRNGRWVKLGKVGVDSASIGITDLLVGVSGSALQNVDSPDNRYAAPGNGFAGDWGTGIRFWAGFGDGGYDVWGWVVDYGEDGETDERVAQVTVTMIDDDELAQWRSGV